MVYQEIELLMKELAFAAYFFAPRGEEDEVVRKRRERIQKLTLGGTVDEVMVLFEPYQESDKPGSWIETKVTLNADLVDKDKERERLSAVIEERNWLVHGCFRELCLCPSSMIREEAEARIERQYGDAEKYAAAMRERLQFINEGRSAMAEYLRGIGSSILVFQSQAGALLSDARALKVNPDGAFLLQRAIDLIRGRGRFSAERFNKLREQGIESLLQQVEPRLRFEDRKDGERVDRYGILPRD